MKTWWYHWSMVNHPKQLILFNRQCVTIDLPMNWNRNIWKAISSELINNLSIKINSNQFNFINFFSSKRHFQFIVGIFDHLDHHFSLSFGGVSLTWKVSISIRYNNSCSIISYKYSKSIIINKWLSNLIDRDRNQTL